MTALADRARGRAGGISARHLGSAAAVAAFGIGYAVAFPTLFAQFDAMAVAFSAVPVAAVGWAFGLRAGVVAALVAIPAIVLLLWSVGAATALAILQSLPGLFVLLLIGATTGRLRDISEGARRTAAEAERRREEAESLAVALRASEVRLQADVEELQAVNEVAARAVRLDLGATLQAAVDAFQRVTTSDATAIYLWDARRERLALTALTFDPSSYPADYPRRVRERELALGEGLVGWVARYREAALVDDAAKDPRPQALSGDAVEAKSAIAVPLVVEDRLLGVIQAAKMGVGSYSQDHFRFARTLASQAALAIDAAEAQRAQGDRLAEMRTLHQASTRLVEASTLADILSGVLDGAMALTGAEAGFIWRRSEDGTFALAATRNVDREAVAALTPDDPNSLSNAMLRSGRPLRVNDVQDDLPPLRRAAISGLRGAVGVPLRSEGRTYGSLFACHSAAGHFRESDERNLEVLAAHAGAALARAHAFEEMQRQAITDDLTGFYNARHFTARLAAEVLRAERYRHPLALVMVDSDALKKVNDRLGHEAGNRLLVDLARAIRENVRATDVVARYGGDEFLVLQPETTLEAARATGERIRRAALATVGEGLETSVSVGVAGYPAHAADAESLFRKADEALLEAKRRGKNAVVTA